MNADQSQRERLEELLADRAVDGLDPAETAELEVLLARLGHEDPEGYDLAAAFAQVAAAPPAEPMPAAVASRARRTLATGAPAPREDAGRAEQSAAHVRPPYARPYPPRRRGVTGWIAAAAALVLAVVGWWPRPDGCGPEELTAARDTLLAEAPDAVRIEWSNTGHRRAQRLEGGYVVWSDERQQGYMTFEGIPENDPSEHQYQLWIFDASRSEEYPVDGGVFDARRNEVGEVVIPIENKLPVRQAALFAVTLEPPGGVVVSDRDPILWVAEPEAQSS
ncbi:MAG: anti-sigma factor domain-containing protein [Halofilum sp. (in: g-proteobacteria)]